VVLGWDFEAVFEVDFSDIFFIDFEETWFFPVETLFSTDWITFGADFDLLFVDLASDFYLSAFAY
jgi:hypothetical protein